MLQKFKKTHIILICIGIFLLVAGLATVVITQMVNKSIRVSIDGTTTSYQTTSRTISEFLDEENIKLDKLDEISPATSQWLTDGDKIKITRAVEFTLSADGKVRTLKALPKSIGETLDFYDVSVGSKDKIVPALSQQLTAGTEIVINRIITKEKTVTKSTGFQTQTQGSNDLPAGTTKVVKQGKKGKVKITYACTYSDGKLIKKKELSRKTVKKPVTKVVAKSTRGTIAGAEYKKKFTVKAYAYSGGGRTALGTAARPGAIAVDPSVIPLGTRVYVEGYGFATAEDTGGDIKGNTIDVYKTSEGACNTWGVRYVNIYIL